VAKSSAVAPPSGTLKSVGATCAIALSASNKSPNTVTIMYILEFFMWINWAAKNVPTGRTTIKIMSEVPYP